MTEYDYSPDAIERQRAKQSQIADWVQRTKQHEPANPFFPIPGEHAPSETYSPPPQTYHSAPQYPYHSQQPQPTLYAIPQGMISPTHSVSKRRHHRSKHHHSGSHHGRRSKTPPSMTVLSPNGMMVPVAMTSPQSYFGYPAQQHQLYQPQVLGYSSSYLTSPPVIAQTYSRSSSYSDKKSSSHLHPTGHSYQPQMNYAVQSPPLQSPPYGQGYQLILAGQNAQVVDSDYRYHRRDSDSESDRGDGSSFFGALKLKGLGMSLKGRSRKSKKWGRNDSH